MFKIEDDSINLAQKAIICIDDRCTHDQHIQDHIYNTFRQANRDMDSDQIINHNEFLFYLPQIEESWDLEGFCEKNKNKFFIHLPILEIEAIATKKTNRQIDIFIIAEKLVRSLISLLFIP